MMIMPDSSAANPEVAPDAGVRRGPEVTRRTFLVCAGAAAGAVTLAACGGEPVGVDAPAAGTTESQNPASPEAQTPTPEVKKAPVGLLRDTVESILASAEQVSVDIKGEQRTGLRWRSAIQGGNNQTDMDVGAAGIGMGLLQLAQEFPDDPRLLESAKQAAYWLSSVAQYGANTVSWPDYANDGDVATETYTSHDDGAAGIGLFYMELYQVTRDPEHLDMAVKSLNWLLQQAEKTSHGYRWPYDASTDDDNYQMGMGMGTVGIVQTLTRYHALAKGANPALAAMCQTYITGAVEYVEYAQRVLAAKGVAGDVRALPETDPTVDQDGNTNMNSGYLSGAAGLAFMYLSLHQEFGGDQYQQKAVQTLGWLLDDKQGPMVKIGKGQAAWKLALDREGGDDDQLPTGFEEGAAGIGWILLQAYHSIRDPQYLAAAQQAGNWLVAVATKKGQQYMWHEDHNPTNPLVHVNLNNGAAGIGMFMHDLAAMSTGPSKQRYAAAANGAQEYITTAARRSGNAVGWTDNGGLDDDGNRPPDYQKDSSMHWGATGIAMFLLHRQGLGRDAPGFHPALVRAR